MYSNTKKILLLSAIALVLGMNNNSLALESLRLGMETNKVGMTTQSHTFAVMRLPFLYNGAATISVPLGITNIDTAADYIRYDRKAAKDFVSKYPNYRKIRGRFLDIMCKDTKKSLEMSFTLLLMQFAAEEADHQSFEQSEALR